MHFYNLIKDISKNEKVKLFVDMDGVIASYDFGKPLDFKNKRPLNSNIEVLRNVSKLGNVELNILSVCRENYQIDEKNDWLDKYAPFFKKENRYILSKETISNMSSSSMKSDFLKNINTKDKMILLDDDIRVLRTVHDNINNIILFQDSELVD